MKGTLVNTYPRRNIATAIKAKVRNQTKIPCHEWLSVVNLSVVTNTIGTYFIIHISMKRTVVKTDVQKRGRYHTLLNMV